ncbi:hypothetical protein Q604_UNBC06382G0001, partial [human gut metagenome]
EIVSPGPNAPSTSIIPAGKILAPLSNTAQAQPSSLVIDPFNRLPKASQ